MEEKPECYGTFPKVAPSVGLLFRKGCIIDPLYDSKHGIERIIIEEHYIHDDPTDEENDWLVCKYWNWNKNGDCCCLYESWFRKDEDL